MNRRRRRRLRKRWLFFPLLMAALVIWLVAGQRASRRPWESGTLTGEDGREAAALSHDLEGEEREKEGEDKEAGAAQAEESAAESREQGTEKRVIRLETEETSGTGKKAGEAGAAGEKAAQPESEQDKITLLFAGDIYLSDHVLGAYDRAGGIGGVLDEELRNAIEEADIFMANQEFPFSDRGTAAEDKQFTFRLPTSRISVLQEIGPDIVTLANNHALDYGTDALLDTCAVLDEAGILRVGAGSNLDEARRMETVEIGGLRIGFLGASRVFPEAGWAAGASRPGMLSAYDPAALSEEIRKAKERCDYLVVYVHWGIERNTMPESYQRTQGRQYIDAGADLVVGSHPHVLQGMEFYQGKPILYSLGNFVFGSSIPETMLVRVTLDPKELLGGAENGGTRTGVRENSEEETDEAEAGTAAVQLSLLPATSSAGYTRQLEREKWPDFFEKLESLSEGIEIDGSGQVTK